MKNRLALVSAVLALIFLIVLTILVLPEGKSADEKSADERLKEAIINNNKDEVKKALNDGADPNLEINGYPALVQAVRQLNERYKDITIAQALVSAGADYTEPLVITSAMKLCASELYLLDLETEFVPYIISLGADVNTKIDGVNDVFCFALKHNLNYRIMYAAAAQGCDVNVYIDGGEYLPLEYAIRTALHSKIDTLVRLGCEIPQMIDGKTVKTYVLERYGADVAKSFYSTVFAL